MTSRKLAAAATSAVAALIFASPASAQTAAAPAVTHGAALPGVCYLSTQEALATSTVGKYVGTRMQQLITQVNTELKPEQTAIETEGKTLETSRATMDPKVLQTRATAWQTRAQNFQQRAGQRQRELEATQQKAVARVLQEMDPIAKSTYQQRRCSILLDREGVLLGNPAMDLTATVVTGLNARIQQFAFERERLDQQPAAAAK
jgi:Skp family chaperone for outer membrane proteins